VIVLREKHLRRIPHSYFEYCPDNRHRGRFVAVSHSS
jgi:hypothetical protein